MAEAGDLRDVVERLWTGKISGKEDLVFKV